MSIEKKYKEMRFYCSRRWCDECNIHKEYPNHSCGNGYNYEYYDENRCVPMEEFLKCYEIAFGLEALEITVCDICNENRATEEYENFHMCKYCKDTIRKFKTLKGEK